MLDLNALDTPSAAKRIGVAAKTLENWRTMGRGPRYLKAGARVIYRPVDLDEWAEARIVSSTSQQVPA